MACSGTMILTVIINLRDFVAFLGLGSMDVSETSPRVDLCLFSLEGAIVPML